MEGEIKGSGGKDRGEWRERQRGVEGDRGEWRLRTDRTEQRTRGRTLINPVSRSEPGSRLVYRNRRLQKKTDVIFAQTSRLNRSQSALP